MKLFRNKLAVLYWNKILYYLNINNFFTGFKNLIILCNPKLNKESSQFELFLKEMVLKATNIVFSWVGDLTLCLKSHLPLPIIE